MKKRFWIFPAAVVLMSCGGGASGYGPGAAGEVVFYEGTVTLNGGDVVEGDLVMDGDVLETGDGSYVEVEFGDHRVLRATEGSRMTIDLGEHTMRLDSGALAVIQSKARELSRGKAWEVQTPTVVAAVRGTVYYVRVESPDSSYFCLCNGAIHLEDVEGVETLDYAAAHHDAYRFVREGDGIAISDAPMIYHTDELMEGLADSVNVGIDWS